MAAVNKNNSGMRAFCGGTCTKLTCIHLQAVKRIMQEARELANDPSTDYFAAPLEVCPNIIQ